MQRLSVALGILWAARIITAGLQDIAVALVEGVEPPGPAGLVAARSIVRP
jgi:hypothetical protein